MSEFKFPTEEVDLPSKGLIYLKDNPLSSGKVELKYMTAKEEDILTNQSYIQKGTVLDKLLQSLIVDKSIKVDDLFTGDKNALFIAARILGYGKDYNVIIAGKEENIDLTTLEHKEIDLSIFENTNNKFTYKLEHTGTVLEFKLLNGHDDKIIDRELSGLKKISPNSSAELTTRLKHMIISVDGDEEKKTVREFVDNYFLARDARSFREHIRNIQPDVNLAVVLDSGEEVLVPIGLNFFWPDA
jgi:hypothetical protein|tara:strand:- start:2660 stop:3388 length:729 start_codon:yes stop_codon:yes gene_type:complete